MAVSDDRKYTRQYVDTLLTGILGKTLGEVDSSNQFNRAVESPKITGIAGMVIEQSVFGYAKDSMQECDIEVDGNLVELKSTGLRIPKSADFPSSSLAGRQPQYAIAKQLIKDGKYPDNLSAEERRPFYQAKEGMSITGVTIGNTLDFDFETSHFWSKAERLLLVFYEYTSYKVVPALEYQKFPIVGYYFNQFSDAERKQLESDWTIVRDYLQKVNNQYSTTEEREQHYVGFTHDLRPQLLLLELVPAYKLTPKKTNPRYKLKQSFVNTIIQKCFSGSHFTFDLTQSFSSFAELDMRCNQLRRMYGGKTFLELKSILGIKEEISYKSFAEKCIIKMFGVRGSSLCNKINQIEDFRKAGIIAKTITLSPQGGRTEDMKLQHIDFDEWTQKDIDFTDSEVYQYFAEHSFLCPIFQETGSSDHFDTKFLGFKRMSFSESFIEDEVFRMWNDSRKLIFEDRLVWVPDYDRNGEIKKNQSGSLSGAPNFPKSKTYKVFFRGGQNDSAEKNRTECVNGIKMLPQYFWIKGSYIASELDNISFL